MTDPRRALPAVGTLLDSPLLRERCPATPHQLLLEAARQVIAAVRRDPARAPDGDAGWAEAIAAHAEALERPTLRRVHNATGVILHTNLGRAPLARVAVDAIAGTAGGASTLEYALESGQRGSRYTHCVSLLCELTGAEDALVVNNCAAALVLALNTVAQGREAIVSRGELIEIGGNFRVPEIMARSGAVLREVGTTNRTAPQDYRDALGPETGAIVKVHRSNFEMRGFVAEASLRDLARVASDAKVPLLYDFGSGLLLSLASFGLTGEPTAREGIDAGVTLLAMSGDKLMGGPQAGMLLGTRAAIDRCRVNPLTRALRVDKLTIAALSATLALYRDPERAVREIPTLALLTTPADALHRRAMQLAAELAAAGLPAVALASEGSVGGGAFPTARLASWAVALGGDVSQVEPALRHGRTPVIARVADDRVLIDLRAIPPADDSALAAAILQALGERG